MEQEGHFEHSHNFLGASHAVSERRTWIVIVLCSVVMVVEIAGGLFSGSIALIADGLHMSTHAGAMLLAAIAYTYARKYAEDPRFTFGTGKMGDLAGFTSAIILGMIALLILYDSVVRLTHPVPIHFGEALPIAILGLLTNIASAWLLGGADHHHDHDHNRLHHHNHGHRHDDSHRHGSDSHANHATHRDNNIRAALVHVLADAAVSVLVIVSLVLARAFGWLWIDPLAGVVGAIVIAVWAFGLVRDTGRILLDMNPDQSLSERVREAVETNGDRLLDFHLWRLGPGHLGAIASIASNNPQNVSYYRAKLARVVRLSHVTLEIRDKAGDV